MEVVVLDRFNGNTDPEDWISRAERYFNFLGFSEEHWLPLPSFYFDGEALEWFRWMFRNKQFFDWNHFKKKLALRFWKRPDAKSLEVDAQLTRILALLRKLEDKCSPRVLVEDDGISAATVLSREISPPLAEENSSCVDNVESHPELFGTSIVEHSSHVDNLFDEMSTGVFTKEVQETSSASRFVDDLEDIQPFKSLNEFFHSCCPKVVAEVQPETPIEMLDDESPGPKRSEVQLFDECFQRDISKRYISATYIDHEKSRDEFNVHNILSRFSLNARVNSFVVSVNGTTKNHSVWDPGIRFNSLAPTGYTDTMYEDPLKLLGSTDKFCFISYVNSTTQVWDPGQNLRMNSYIVEIIENKMVDIEINGISLTTIEGDNVDSQKEGSQSFHDGLHSTTSRSTLVPTEDWKDLVSCWALPRRTINMVMSSKGQTEISDKSYMRPLQKSIGQQNTKLCFLLLTSTYYELLEPYMDTLFELTTEGSDEDENVIALLAIELWSKVPKLDGLQCCERNRSFRWINHLHLGLKTQMFSLEEDELIVTLCVIFEQRRGQIATQLTETSQDRLVSFFLPVPTVPIHNFGLLVDGYVMLELRCTTSGIVGVVMRGKITYFFGERDELCFSESFCHVGWLAIIFGRNVSWFDIGSVLMGYGIWVISFKVSTYITEIKPKHLRDSFTIINQLTICYRRSLIIQLFGLFLIQDSPRWLTKATHWKACTTSLPHFKRNTVSISSTTTSVEEFISILQILSKVKMLDFLKRKDACSLVFGVGLVVLHLLGFETF
ncbi:hypothetical protein KY290_024425 [Solanum tuberosum]|uniref:Sugar transporter n=1 Tax=Solanum tuberosum TaxID=4113 RepID=A0ABQ7UQM4_SOLTU|nr:hypothetical protein KY290_024425 [Solanum tuberosum]